MITVKILSFEPQQPIQDQLVRYGNNMLEMNPCPSLWRNNFLKIIAPLCEEIIWAKTDCGLWDKF